jgi:4-hydroxybenzoate polyprenyltransferase
LPSIAVTAVSAGLVALADLPTGRGVVIVAAVFTGQLSVGWSNDYLDAARDLTVKRTDKPVATGAVSRQAVGIAAVSALVATSALSAVLGWPGGAVALLTVLSAWAYNLGVKATAWSWLPYVVSFGLSPAVVTLSALPPRWPPLWTMTVGALLGMAAHLANVLPDLREDLATGVRGIAHRIGARSTALATAGVLVATAAIILVGPPGQPGAWNWAGFAATVAIGAVAGRIAYADPNSRLFFRAIVVITALALVSFALSGVEL